MRINQLMKQAPVAVLASDTLEEAADKMRKIDCGILPVVDGSTSMLPIGVITDRDIVMRCVAHGQDPRVVTVGDACTQPAICCDDDCSAADAFHTMRDHKIGRLLVIDARGSLVGILSQADVIARVPIDIWAQLPGSHHPQPRRAA